MATIYEFRTGARTSSLVARMSGASAEIVFFPGVRYERYDEKTEQAEKPKRKTRRRDKIELAE